jgi:hypothetical protein
MPACGSTKSGASNVTLTGQLSGGTYSGFQVSPEPGLDSAVVSTQSALQGPLAGYQLSCVTFGNPPVAGVATADSSGNFSLTLAALNIPFGCFILDSSGASVASLVFTSGSTNSQTASFSQGGSLGTIIVDNNSGLAQASLPSSGTAVTATPSGTACPVGTWAFQVVGGFTSPCGTPTGIIWLAQMPNGQYVASYTVGPVSQSQGVCGSQTQSNLPATYTNGVLRFVGTDNGGTSSCDQTRTFSFTPSADCSSATGSGMRTTCSTCGAGGSCNGGCGTQSCAVAFTATRR